MKNKFFFLVPSIFLIYFSSYVFLVGLRAGMEGENLKPYLLVFIISLFANFFYYLWLALKRRIDHKLVVLYVPAACILFGLFVYAMISPPYKRSAELNLGLDPFSSSDASTIRRTSFYFWEKGFYFPEKAIKQREIEEKAKVQKTRRGSLIGHVGTSLQGWSSEKILDAFGEPLNIIQVEHDLEKWIYDPWTDHPDWEMPVYVKDGVLSMIGDSNIQSTDEDSELTTYRCFHLGESWVVFSDARTTLSFCYSTAWGYPSFKKGGVGPEGQRGDLYRIRFSGVANYGAPGITYYTQDYKKLGDSDVPPPIKDWDLLDFSKDELELARLFLESDNPVVQKVKINGKDVLKVYRNYFNEFMQARVSTVSYYVPDVSINGQLHNLTIGGSPSQQAEMDVVLATIVSFN